MTKFTDLGLNSELLTAIDALGFTQATEIQSKAIPILLNENTDLIGLAQTGTGKTAAFGLPLLQKIDSESSKTQGLILSPTRELCLQITRELQNYAAQMPVNIVAVYGGASISEQEKKIRRGAQIIVATPGRMKDMLSRRMIDISHLSYCILDEADEMLNMGFHEDITDILKYSPSEKQTWLFSATMPREVSAIAQEFMDNPTEITVGNKNESTKNVSHEYYVVGARNRYKALKRLVDAHPDIFAVVFCRTKRDTQKVAEKLAEEGYNAAALHGDLSQNQRDLVMKSFRNQQIQILVATDVAARGIDVDDVTHVIHYQLPDETEVYTHRSGRTGRAGKTGVSMVLITKSEQRKIKQIEKIINQKFTLRQLPEGSEICKIQLFHLAQKINDTQVDPAIQEYLPELNQKFEELSKEDLVKRLFTVEFSRFHNYYKNEEDINIDPSSSTREDDQSVRYFINVGSRDGLNWQSLKDMLKEVLNFTQDEVSHVDVMQNFSFFNTDQSAKQKVLTTLENYMLNGREVRVEETDQKRSRGNRGRNKSGRSGRSDGRRSGGRNRSFGKSRNNRSGKGEGSRHKDNRKHNIKSSVNRRKNKNKR